MKTIVARMSQQIPLSIVIVGFLIGFVVGLLKITTTRRAAVTPPYPGVYSVSFQTTAPALDACRRDGEQWKCNECKIANGRATCVYP